MDARQFDQIVARLGSGRTRRQTVAALFGVALAGRTLTADEEAAAKSRGQCDLTCGECTTCQPGKCRKSRSGRRRCQPGSCLPHANGTSCSGGRTCQNSICSCADPSRARGQTCCRPDQICYDSRCSCTNAYEECQGQCLRFCKGQSGYSRNPDTCSCCQRNSFFFDGECQASNCCSGKCETIPGSDPLRSFCVGRDRGASCAFNSQCASSNCRAGVCA